LFASPKGASTSQYLLLRFFPCVPLRAAGDSISLGFASSGWKRIAGMGDFLGFSSFPFFGYVFLFVFNFFI